MCHRIKLYDAFNVTYWFTHIKILCTPLLRDKMPNFTQNAIAFRSRKKELYSFLQKNSI